MTNIGIAIHGGAGTLLKANMSKAKEKAYKNALEESLDTAYSILGKGGSALEATELAVRYLEDSPLFNAGKGSVFSASGMHEMDAAIMDGLNLDAGAAAAVSSVRNPIQLAFKILSESEHVILNGKGAEQFAKTHNIPFEKDAYFYDELRFQQWQSIKDSDSFQLDHSSIPEKDEKFGTVGAVALDMYGNLAAATSTGGMTNKKFGRIGDSPIIGAGTYANNKTCAVSCTGSGEFFIRAVTAYDVSSLMEYGQLSLEEAGRIAVFKNLTNIGGDGGLIAIDIKGNIIMPFNTAGMYRALMSSKRKKEVLIYK